MVLLSALSTEGIESQGNVEQLVKVTQILGEAGFKVRVCAPNY